MFNLMHIELVSYSSISILKESSMLKVWGLPVWCLCAYFSFIISTLIYFCIFKSVLLISFSRLWKKKKLLVLYLLNVKPDEAQVTIYLWTIPSSLTWIEISKLLLWLPMSLKSWLELLSVLYLSDVWCGTLWIS